MKRYAEPPKHIGPPRYDATPKVCIIAKMRNVSSEVSKERARNNLIKFMFRQAQHERCLSFKLLNLFRARS
jgi:hypothetical protein